MDTVKIILGSLLIAALLILYKRVQEKSPSINFREAYQPRQLLTNRELQEYLKLKQYADARGWLICPKVRLWDLIEPKRGVAKKQTLENKIRSKHVDFVLVDQSMNVIGVLELDDSTHDRKDRKMRDNFVRDALEGAGITMIQTRSITPDTLNGFLKIQPAYSGPSFEEWKAARENEKR